MTTATPEGPSLTVIVLGATTTTTSGDLHGLVRPAGKKFRCPGCFIDGVVEMALFLAGHHQSSVGNPNGLGWVPNHPGFRASPLDLRVARPPTSAGPLRGGHARSLAQQA